MELSSFWFTKIHDIAGDHLKNSNNNIAETHYPMHYMYAHRPYNIYTLPSDSIMTVDAYDGRLDIYFVREGIKRKNEKADLEKIMHKEYTLDWSQSKVFLVQFTNCLILCYVFCIVNISVHQ